MIVLFVVLIAIALVVFRNHIRAFLLKLKPSPCPTCGKPVGTTVECDYCDEFNAYRQTAP